MKENLNVSEQLKKKYHKTEEVTNFKDMLYRSADIYRSRTAFKLKNKDGEIYTISYEQFKRDVVSLGTSLLERGFLGKKIAVIGKNSYPWCVSYMAASIVGIVVPIDKELLTDDVINFMNVSEAVCILGDDKNLSAITKSIDTLENKETTFIYFNAKTDANSFDTILQNGQISYANGNTKFDDITINPDELRILLFTSGTTGNAKGVCLSQRNICSNILSTYGIVKVKEVMCFSLFYLYTILMNVL